MGGGSLKDEKNVRRHLVVQTRMPRQSPCVIELPGDGQPRGDLPEGIARLGRIVVSVHAQAEVRSQLSV